MLDADYEIHCFTDDMTSLWWVIAVASAVGLVVVSLGLPLSMYYIMRRDWQRKLRRVRQQSLSMPAAYRQHGQKFAYICGEFRPQAYYAESIDLVRKLVLTGLITLVTPGSIVQAFCQVLCSLVFTGIHVRLW